MAAAKADKRLSPKVRHSASARQRGMLDACVRKKNSAPAFGRGAFASDAEMLLPVMVDGWLTCRFWGCAVHMQAGSSNTQNVTCTQLGEEVADWQKRPLNNVQHDARVDDFAEREHVGCNGAQRSTGWSCAASDRQHSESENKHIIADAVRDWLLRRTVDSQLQDYATSLGIDDVSAALCSLAGRQSTDEETVYENSALEGLLEFLLFPDEELCLNVEQGLGAAALEGSLALPRCRVAGDFVQAVCRLLEDAEIVVQLRESEQAEPPVKSVRFKPPQHLLSQLVLRLHVHKFVPACVVDFCLEPVQPEKNTQDKLQQIEGLSSVHAQIRQLVRRSALDFTPFRCAMMQRYLACVPLGYPQFLQGLRLWLALLEQSVPVQENWQQAQDELFTLLSKRRARLNKTLREGQEFEERLRRYNMETLMMQGVRPPAENPANIREDLRILDRVSIALFQRMPDGAELTEHDLGAFGSAEALAQKDGTFDPEAEVMALMQVLS